MKVLFVNHTAVISGGERSLLTMLETLPDGVEAAVACPDGPLAEALETLRVERLSLPGTAGSLKLHPLHTPRAAADMARAGVALRRCVDSRDPDIVHANSIRAGLVASLALWGRRPALVVHVRDCLPPSRATGTVQAIIGRRADLVVANSRYTADALGDAVPAARKRVLHSPVDIEGLRARRLPRDEARHRLGLDDGETVVLGVVAQLTPWKGQDDAVRILAGLREAGFSGELLLVGSAKFVARATRHDNQAFVAELKRLISRLDLSERVHLLGERDDIPEVLSAVDLVLLPSWEEPFGRVVAEAMAIGVPVAATAVGGPSEIVRDGIDGLLLQPRMPETWVRALLPVLREPGRLDAMGSAAAHAAAETSRGRGSEDLESIWRDAARD